MLEIHLDEQDDCQVCRPIGELDSYTVSQFRQSIASLATEKFLVIDLSGVPFIDSAGLGALIGVIRRTRELGGDVAVVCNRPTLLRLLATTGFDRIAIVTDTVSEAATSLKEKTSLDNS